MVKSAARNQTAAMLPWDERRKLRVRVQEPVAVRAACGLPERRIGGRVSTMKTALEPDAILYFGWDRLLTVRQIHDLLMDRSDAERVRLAAWIMREARFEDVWQFLRPEWVRDHFKELRPRLGRKLPFWNYILGMWHELGKI